MPGKELLFKLLENIFYNKSVVSKLSPQLGGRLGVQPGAGPAGGKGGKPQWQQVAGGREGVPDQQPSATRYPTSAQI